MSLLPWGRPTLALKSGLVRCGEWFVQRLYQPVQPTLITSGARGSIVSSVEELVGLRSCLDSVDLAQGTLVARRRGVADMNDAVANHGECVEVVTITFGNISEWIARAPKIVVCPTD